MVITFTLQSVYSGATYVAGPFDISGTTSGNVTTLLGNNISKADLLTGVTISNIDDATTGGTIQSVDGTCSNSVQWLASGGQVNDTYSFDIYCTEYSGDPTNNAAYQTVVFTGTALGLVPTTNTYLKINGSGNVNYIYVFNGVIGEPTTPTSISQILAFNEFTCDGPQV